MRLKIFAYNEVHACVGVSVSVTCDHAQVHPYIHLFVCLFVTVCVWRHNNSAFGTIVVVSLEEDPYTPLISRKLRHC